MSHNILKWACALAFLPAFAQTAQGGVTRLTARLAYERGGMPGCPSEKQLRADIASGLDYDPFQPGAPLLLSIALRDSTEPKGLVAEISLTDDHGRLLGQQRIHSQGDCRSLASAAALVARIALEPASESSAKAATVTAAPSASPALTASAPPFTEAHVSNQSSSRAAPVRVVVEAGPLVAVAASVSPNAGVLAGGEARWERFSIGLQLRVDFPSGAALPNGGTEQTWLTAGGVVPCLRFGPLATCGLLFVGREESSGTGLQPSKVVNTLYAAAGGRLSGELWLINSFGLALTADLLVPFARTQTYVSDQPVWSTPPVSGVFSLTALSRIF
jgi:hypothetical protein